MQSKEFSSYLFENIYISGIMYVCTPLELCIMYFFEIDPEWSVKLGSVSPSTPGALRSSLFCRDQTTIDQRYEGWSYWIVFNVLIISHQTICCTILRKVEHHCHFQSLCVSDCFRFSNIDNSNSGEKCSRYNFHTFQSLKHIFLFENIQTDYNTFAKVLTFALLWSGLEEHF